MADDGLYDDIEDISTREEPVAVSSAPLKDDESGVYVTTTDESQAPAGNDAAPAVEKAATHTAQNALTALYVGNLHWWVTDVQLQTMCEEFGKLRTPPRFFEDRVNGKSKVRHPPSYASLRSRRRPTRSPANPRPPGHFDRNEGGRNGMNVCQTACSNYTAVANECGSAL